MKKARVSVRKPEPAPTPVKHTITALETLRFTEGQQSKQLLNTSREFLSEVQSFVERLENGDVPSVGLNPSSFAHVVQQLATLQATQEALRQVRQSDPFNGYHQIADILSLLITHQDQRKQLGLGEHDQIMITSARAGERMIDIIKVAFSDSVDDVGFQFAIDVLPNGTYVQTRMNEGVLAGALEAYGRQEEFIRRFRLTRVS